MERWHKHFLKKVTLKLTTAEEITRKLAGTEQSMVPVADFGKRV